jgi:hypothetical protein
MLKFELLKASPPVHCCVVCVGVRLVTECVFLFSLKLLSKTFLILRQIQRDIFKNVEKSSCKVTVILVGF